MNKLKLSAIAGTVAALALGVGGATFVSAATTPAPKVEACVKYGPSGGKDATGNYVLYNWNRSKCPNGTYAVSWDSQGPAGENGATGAAGSSGILGSTTKDLGGVASVTTGGPFVTNASDVGDITFQPGTYEIAVNAKATPNVSDAVAEFPVFAVYNQAANSSFTGDLFNVGAGNLATTNTSIDSYFSGSATETFTAATTLHFYAFGYKADRSAGSYTLDDLSVTSTQINAGS